MITFCVEPDPQCAAGVVFTMIIEGQEVRLPIMFEEARELAADLFTATGSEPIEIQRWDGTDPIYIGVQANEGETWTGG